MAKIKIDTMRYNAPVAKYKGINGHTVQEVLSCIHNNGKTGAITSS